MFFHPVDKMDSDNSIICLKMFCTMLDYPTLLQSNNGSGYKNEKFKKFFEDNKIQHTLSSPYHPQIKGL